MKASANHYRFGVANLIVREGDRAILDGIDVEAAPGTVRAIVGGDGAGKTTLLRVLAGTRVADVGSVRRPKAQRIGALIETPAVYADLSVGEHVGFAEACYGTTDPARTRELLSRAGLLGARDRLGGQLSGGMRQKLAVVLALLHRPELVLLDEPTTGIDPVSRAELWRLISRAAVEGAAVLMSTTYLDEAERADVAYVLDEGRMLLAGPPESLLADAPGTFGITESPAADVLCWRRGRTWRLWSPNGTLPAGARRDQPTLDDLVISAQLARERVSLR